MRTLEHEVSRLPRIIPIALLAHPTIVVGCTDLFKDTLPAFQVGTQSGNRHWSYSGSY